MVAVMEQRTDCSSELDGEMVTRVLALARQRLSSGCPYAFYFRGIDCNYEDGVLTLHGRLPTYYLKQVLQTMLANVDGVTRIENQVDVVSSTGLSSVRPK